MNSRFCRWLIVSALLIAASGAWAQQGAPPASDQKPETLTASQRTLQCSFPPAFDQKSIAAFKQQAASGDAAAQCGLGLMCAQGTGVPQDYTQAAVWYRKAAEQGNAAAQVVLGAWYNDGLGVPQDYTQAAAWFRKAAEQGNADAQRALGVLYSGHGVPQDYTQAALWYRKAAEQGDVLAQGGLGLLYESGHGVPQDYSEAYFWFDLAAAGKQEASQAEAATKIRDAIASHLTPADLSREQERARKWFEEHQAKPPRSAYTQAAGWFRKAADQGDAHAQYGLGVLYNNGQGVPQDYAQAVTWYRKAADQGNAEAQFALALVYDTGEEGVAKDSAEAARWLRKAADQGLADAQFGLAAAYMVGNGVPRDYSEAYFWLSLAASGPSQDISKQKERAKERDEVASLLSNTALLQAQERARKWFEAHQAKPQ